MDSGEWLRRFDAAVAKGRAADATAEKVAEACAELKALGFADGDAIYHLRRKPR